MTLVSAIITDALRENNRVPLGQSLDTALQTEGLTLLNRIVASVMGWEVGENLVQWPVGITGYQTAPARAVASVWAYPDPNVMIAANLTSAQTIYLPQQPSDGARIGVQDLQGNFATYNLILNGNGRRIESAASVTLSTNSLNRSWFFRADTGNWVRFSSLGLTDTFPFPAEFDDYFTTRLALRMSPRFGPKPDVVTIAEQSRAHAQFVARYVQSQNLKINWDISQPHLSIQSYNNSFYDPNELLT